MGACDGRSHGVGWDRRELMADQRCGHVVSSMPLGVLFSARFFCNWTPSVIVGHWKQVLFAKTATLPASGKNRFMRQHTDGWKWDVSKASVSSLLPTKSVPSMVSQNVCVYIVVHSPRQSL